MIEFKGEESIFKWIIYMLELGASRKQIREILWKERRNFYKDKRSLAQSVDRYIRMYIEKRSKWKEIVNRAVEELENEANY